MISPKEFYHKLDEILASIDHLEEKNDYLISILEKLLASFRKSLNILDGCLYEEGSNQFYLINNPPKMCNFSEIPEILTFESLAIQLAFRHGCYIYDNPAESPCLFREVKSQYTIPAIILIHGREKRWLLLFLLGSGWIREEIEFCFNIVRRSVETQLSFEFFKNNLQSAAKIQQSLLPKKAPQIPGYEIAFRSQPAELVGGDLLDFFVLDSNTFAVAIGDAVGHDLPAALLVRDVVTGLRMGIEKEMKTTYAIRKLNRVIHQSTYSAAYVSLFYAEVENHGSLFYVNAGHPAPILIYKQAIHVLEATGTIIGPLPEIDPKRGYNYMPPGSIFVLYTDGIFERRNQFGENFNINRLEELVLLNQEKSSQELIDLIFKTAFEFGDSLEWEDDVSVIIVKRLIEEK